jgi:hypothetical protein
MHPNNSGGIGSVIAPGGMDFEKTCYGAVR